jgi:hypothetical protein
MKRLVRILRSTVMVRVGGGWEALDGFLAKHDPCRAKACFYFNRIDILDYFEAIIRRQFFLHFFSFLYILPL